MSEIAYTDQHEWWQLRFGHLCLCTVMWPCQIHSLVRSLRYWPRKCLVTFNSGSIGFIQRIISEWNVTICILLSACHQLLFLLVTLVPYVPLKSTPLSWSSLSQAYVWLASAVACLSCLIKESFSFSIIFSNPVVKTKNSGLKQE